MDWTKVQALCALWSRSDRIEDRFEIAQALCAVVKPELQEALNRLRREVLSLVREPPKAGKRTRIRQHVMLGKARREAADWSDFVFTPELDRDTILDGVIAPKAIVGRLQRALEAQQRIVRRTLKRAGGGGAAGSDRIYRR